MASLNPNLHQPSGTTSRSRRPLAFQSLAEIQADIDQLLMQNEGQIYTLGQLTPAQNIGHIAFFIDSSVHGFPYTFPWPMRLIGSLLRERAMSRPVPAGIKMPAGMRRLDKINFPPVETSLETAVDALAAAIEAASHPGAMCQKSPLFGQLDAKQWTRLHCLHADLHFSFLY